MTYYKVRFHLGAGPNYMKWQVRKGKADPFYLDPESCCLSMKNCLLKNNKRLAREIHAGANKTVCAWILCEGLEVLPKRAPQGLEIGYNPRKNPFWTDGNEDLDDRRFSLITSEGRKLYATN